MSTAGKSILMVDDDQEIRELLQTYLSRSGFQVHAEADGAGFRRALDSSPCDLVILDVMLPDEDGFSLCRWVRQHPRRARVPIIMLTASSDEADRVIGLELGADDYLVKPFSFVELLLRIRTLLRRGVVREPEHFHLADLQLDLLRRRVTRGDDLIVLTNKEFALLHLLLRREGEVLSRTLIAAEVWDMNFDSDTNVVDVAIKRLRAKVDNPYPVKLIHTVRGIGYVCEVRP